jgi:hypothetical protein
MSVATATPTATPTMMGTGEELGSMAFSFFPDKAGAADVKRAEDRAWLLS